MAEAELIPYTEDELYVVPKKETKGEPAKVCQMPPVNPLPKPVKPNFLKENKGLLITITVVLVALGIYLYYRHQKDKEKRGS